jgi:hypothetical protein
MVTSTSMVGQDFELGWACLHMTLFAGICTFWRIDSESRSCLNLAFTWCNSLYCSAILHPLSSPPLTWRSVLSCLLDFDLLMQQSVLPCLCTLTGGCDGVHCHLVLTLYLCTSTWFIVLDCTALQLQSITNLNSKTWGQYVLILITSKVETWLDFLVCFLSVSMPLIHV